MRINNNQDVVANRINELNLVGVSAVGDDGSVCVDVSGSSNRVSDVSSILAENFGQINIGDGIQSGGIWINANDINIHCELSEIN